METKIEVTKKQLIAAFMEWNDRNIDNPSIAEPKSYQDKEYAKRQVDALLACIEAVK